MKRGNYIDLLDPDQYYTVTPARRVHRQRINNNLLGEGRFCPTIRRTDILQGFEAADLPGRCRKVVSGYPPEMLKRALSYLYYKETKSSFEIEHIKPNSTRTERFVALLQLAEREDFSEKTKLINLQNCIVDPRFSESDYRPNQNYVGETVTWQKEMVYFACPKPEDLADFQDENVQATLISCRRMKSLAWNRQSSPPTEAISRTMHDEYIHEILTDQRSSLLP